MNRILLYLIAALPALLPVGLILDYSVDFPFWDQWLPSLAGVIIKAQQHTLTLADLASQHNEHRFLVPRLIYIPLALLTNWNIRAELFAEWMIVCLTSLGILRLIHVTQPRMGARIPLLWLVSNLLIFNIVQFENWLWGLGVANVLPMFFITLAMVILSMNLRCWPQTVLVILCSIAATFSSGNGILCWPIAAAMLGFSTSSAKLKFKRAPLVVIALALVCTLALYFTGYARPAQSTPLSFHPLRSLHYFLAFLGNLFAFTSNSDPTLVATTLGATMLGLTILCAVYALQLLRIHKDRDAAMKIINWLLVASFPILSAALASLARGGQGATQSLSSRYVTFSLYLPLALLQMLWIIISDLKNRRMINPAKLPLSQQITFASPAIFTCLVIVLLFQGLKGAFADAEEFRARQLNFRNAVLFSQVSPDDPILGTIETLSTEELIKTAKTLDDLNYLRPKLLTPATQSATN